MPVYRSFLFAPGNHPRRVEKCLTLSTDAVILDLEDAVAQNEKESTRAVVVQALSQPRRCQAYVRVNALSTPWSYGDIEAVVVAGLDGIVLPKVESAADLLTAEWMISALERARGLTPGAIDLMPIIETAKGYVALESIVRSGTRVKRVAFGAGDFTLDAGIRWTADETELVSYRSQIVVHSRAAGLEPPIDTVWVDLRNMAGFERCVQHVKGLGFQGKMCIHPDQIPLVNQAFRPSPEELTRAQKMVSAFEEAVKQGLASIQLEGQFIDYPIAYAAQRVLDREAAIVRSEGAL
ncbi:MAG: CoA ester lyase [Limnohabitans sp.]|jgi:citrate lyase subunit beta/citryl-CoA lyase|nr:CoA ester lyase [Limnohabitans sp.]